MLTTAVPLPPSPSWNCGSPVSRRKAEWVDLCRGISKSKFLQSRWQGKAQKAWSTTICRRGDTVSSNIAGCSVDTSKRDVPLSRQLDIFQPLNQSCSASCKTIPVLWSWLLANPSPAPPKGQEQGKKSISDTLEDGIKFCISSIILLRISGMMKDSNKVNQRKIKYPDPQLTID